MVKDKIQCSKKVYPNDRWGSFHGHQCRLKAVVQRDGKSYCRIHDPVKEESKRQERQKKWDEEWEKRREERRRQLVMIKACEDVPTEVLEKIKVKELLESIQRKKNGLRNS